MNFVITSSRVPIGRKPIHHWSLKWLLREFGISLVTPSIRDECSARELKKLARGKGRKVSTIQKWRRTGTLPKHQRKLRVPLPPKKTFVPGKKLGLWELWEMARARWKKLRRELHPDASRKPTDDLFATMSHIYDTIMRRFEAKGIGIA